MSDEQLDDLHARLVAVGQLGEHQVDADLANTLVADGRARWITSVGPPASSRRGEWVSGWTESRLLVPIIPQGDKA